MEVRINNLKLTSNANPINLEFKTGNIIGICGDDSKYLFSKVIPRLKQCFSGTITIDNVFFNPKRPKEFRKNIAFLYQNPENSFATKKVSDELYFGMHYYKLNWHNLGTKTQEVFNLLEIKESLADRDIESLSYTEKKEIMWASTMFYDPKIIIMEDYEKGYRSKDQQKIKRIIKDQAKKDNKLIIIVSNNIKYLYDLVDEVYIFHKNNIVLSGDKNIFFNQAIKEYLEIPEILSFIEYAKKRNINLGNTLEINDLIKDIYRNVQL